GTSPTTHGIDDTGQFRTRLCRIRGNSPHSTPTGHQHSEGGRSRPRFCRLNDRSLAPLAVTIAATAAAATAAPALAVAGRALFLAGARRGVLRSLDQLLGADRATVLVLLQQLETDTPARLVDLLHDH